MRTIDADHVLEGEPVTATLEIRSGPLGLPGAVIDDPLLSRPLHVSARASDPRRLTATARFERRGRHALPPPRITLTDLLGLATITRAPSAGRGTEARCSCCRESSRSVGGSIRARGGGSAPT